MLYDVVVLKQTVDMSRLMELRGYLLLTLLTYHPDGVYDIGTFRRIA